MPVKIRLMRIGAKKRPFFRVVAVDEQKKRTGAYLELLGTYNPLTEPKEIILKQDRIDHWIKMGAQPSDGFLRITGKAPQRPPRKPKKQAKAAPAEAPAQQQAKEADEALVAEAEIPEVETPAEDTASADAPVVSEESIVEAEPAQPAAEAAEAFEKPAIPAEDATSEETNTPEDGSTDQAETADTPTTDTTETLEEEPKK